MPMSGSNYVAPTWVDGGPPALDAAELQAMCDAIVQNQGDAAALQTALQQAVQSLTTMVNGRAQIQIVSYVGTGVGGSSNPCSITADFPISVAISLGYTENDYQNSFIVPHVGITCVTTQTLKTSYVLSRGFYMSTSTDSSYAKRSSDSKTISWYDFSSNPSYQYNYSGYTYYFLCIG